MFSLKKNKEKRQICFCHRNKSSKAQLHHTTDIVCFVIDLHEGLCVGLSCLAVFFHAFSNIHWYIFSFLNFFNFLAVFLAFLALIFWFVIVIIHFNTLSLRFWTLIYYHYRCCCCTYNEYIVTDFLLVFVQR